MKKFLFALGLAGLFTGAATAQNMVLEEDGYNHQSTKTNIHQSDIMWQKTVWRMVDLREKQNEPLFSNEREITKFIMDAVIDGKLTPYKNDSLDNSALEPYTISEFKMRLSADASGMTPEEKQQQCLLECDPDFEDCATLCAPEDAAFFLPKQLYLMELKENLIFDKKRSVLYYDVIAINMYIPEEFSVKGLREQVASFSYKEMYDNVFKNDPNAIWYNPGNEAEHKNLADAFELRMFSSYITKVSNPKDQFLVDIYGGGKTGIMASQWKAFELLEFEHNLWEF